MPYRSEYDYGMRYNPVARQSTIPSRRDWMQNANDVEDIRRQQELEDWYRMNRGMQQPDGSYFGPEMGTMPELNYDPNVRAVGEPMRQYEAFPDYDTRTMDRVSDLILGYDPREGAEGYEPEGMGQGEAALFGGMFMPGKVGRTAGALLGADIAYDIARGRRIPGAIDAMWLGGLGARAARGAVRAGKAFGRGYQAGRARRAAEQAMRSRALNAPKVRRQNARTGRWDEVNAYPEFTPYEEVRF